MDNFFTYLLLSSLCLTVFILFYLLLLKKETFYLGNRAYLIITGSFSVFVPLFKILLPATGYTQQITYIMAPVFVSGKNQIPAAGINWIQLLEAVYFAVMIVLLLKFIFRLIQVFLLMNKNKSVEFNGQKIVVLEKGSTPFSFLKTIFLTDEQIADPSVNNIIAHEKKHIHQFHSVDMIFFEIIKIIQWFNPFAWKYKKEIEAQHEFSADSGLLSDGININDYKSVMVAYSFGTTGGTITNNFNSLLKRRLEMLSRQKSHAVGKIKLFLTLPLMVLLITIIGVVNGSISFASGNKPDDKEKIYKICDKMPTFPGGEKALGEFIGKQIVYPEKAKKSGIQGKVNVEFVIDKDGSVQDVKPQKSIGNGFDEEAVRVVKLMPKWVPGMDKGKVVKVKIVLPIKFALK